jgi:hypothetical protein
MQCAQLTSAFTPIRSLYYTGVQSIPPWARSFRRLEFLYVLGALL